MNNILKMHGLDGASSKGAAAPWDKACEEMSNADEKLPGDEGELFKTGTGIAHYLSKKRYNLQFAVKECRRGVSAPTRRARKPRRRGRWTAGCDRSNWARCGLPPPMLVARGGRGRPPPSLPFCS